MKYCADCVDMGETPNKKGLFKCLNCRKSGYDEVSARQIACGFFTEAFNGRRSETERERLMQISRDHGYYITTFIVETLDLEDKEDYLYAFAYIKEAIMPSLDSSMSWVNDYDTYGPIIADRLKEANNSESLASSLFNLYLKPFKESIDAGETMEAIRTYDSMYQELKVLFGIGVAKDTKAPNSDKQLLRMN